MKMSAKQAVYKHEAAKHPGEPKTKLAKGGATNEMLAKMGAGMARVTNQGPVGRKTKGK